MKKIFILLFVFISFVWASDLRVFKSYDKAISTAKKENKKVLMFIHEDYCPWCDKMKKETFTDEDTIDFINERFIFLTMPRVSAEYPEKLFPKYIPTTHLIDPNKEEMIYTMPGFKPSEHLINELWDFK